MLLCLRVQIKADLKESEHAVNYMNRRCGCLFECCCCCDCICDPTRKREKTRAQRVKV